AYPADPRAHGDEAIVAALRRCRLDQLTSRLDEVQHWARQLSPGEQQLVALARAFLHAPAWLFLDAATAALDEATEQHIYRALREHLADTTIVSIAPRPAVAAFHERHLELTPGGASMRLRERLDQDAPSGLLRMPNPATMSAEGSTEPPIGAVTHSP